MREAAPAFNVELRKDGYGHDAVVFAFPYQPDVVDSVRAVPGRRFDWETREWWAPRADATAPYIKGVLERHTGLTASDAVQTWLERAVTGWVGRVRAGRVDGKGVFLLDRIAGELPAELAAHAAANGTRTTLPFTKTVAATLTDLQGARPDASAERCLQALLVGREPAPATLSLTAATVADNRFRLDVNWDPDTVGAFEDLPGADAHGRTVPIDPALLEALEHYLRRYGVDVAANALLALQDLRREHEAALPEIRRSRAREGEPLECESRLGGELRPFQRAGVRYALATRRTFIADEQGLGKTVEALATLEADDAYPAVIVCPASLKLNWEREIAHWLPHRGVEVVSGGKGALRGADITVLNYEIVAPHLARLLLARPRALVLDESHYVKNPRAKRTQAVRKLAGGLREEHSLRIALTGTPVMNRPEELIAQLRILGRLEDFGSGARFARRFQGPGSEERIHWHLRRRCFVRRLKRDVLPQLPAKRRVIVPVALDNAREYRLAADDVVAWLREQPLDLDTLDARIAATLRAERLAQLTALKRLAAAGKLAAALAWIDDFSNSEEPLVVFSGNRETQAALLERFPDALHVLGSDDVAAREAAVRAFQEPDGPRMIICGTRVGGQGITLTRASNVCFLDLEWTPAMHDQAEDRVHRIGQEGAVSAWYLLAANTIDETMIELIERKRGLVGAVTDGRPDDSSTLVEGVIRALREERPRRHLRVA